jgi:putative lipoic acid-binding regulatory protein
LKVIGHNREDFQEQIYLLVSRHVPGLSRAALTARPSGAGRFLALTVTFTAESREQLEAIYEELSRHELVVLTL